MRYNDNAIANSILEVNYEAADLLESVFDSFHDAGISQMHFFKMHALSAIVNIIQNEGPRVYSIGWHGSS